MTPINKDHVVQIAQILLTYLDDPNNSTPNDMLEGIVSAKSLMRSLVGGNLVICQPGPAPEPKMPKELADAIAAKAAEDAKEDVVAGDQNEELKEEGEPPATAESEAPVSEEEEAA